MTTTSFSSVTNLLIFLAILLGLVMPDCALAYNIMYSGDTLSAGQSLVDGNFVFILQNDCNLVLYDNSRAVWETGTNGQGINCRLMLQRDANLELYNSNNRRVWASNTARSQGNYVLVLQRDRNVVIYGPAIGSTGTNVYGSPNVIISKNTTKLT